MVADGAALRRRPALPHPRTDPTKERHYLKQRTVLALFTAVFLTPPVVSRGEPPAPEAKPCLFANVPARGQTAPTCIEQLGTALEALICGQPGLFEIDGEQLRIKNPPERNSYREEVKHISAASPGCPKEAMDLAAMLNKGIKSENDLLPLITAIFIARRTPHGKIEILQRGRPESWPENAPTTTSPTDAAPSAADASPPLPAPTIDLPSPAPTEGGAKGSDQAASRNGGRSADPASAEQRSSDIGTSPWLVIGTSPWLVAALVWALLLATAAPVLMLFLVRTLRDVGGAINKGSARIEGSVTAMTIGDEKSILAGLTALVNVIRELRTSLQNIESRLEKIEGRLNRFERSIAARPAAQDPRTTIPERSADVTAAATGYSPPSRAASPVPAPEKTIVKEHEVVEGFNECLKTGLREDINKFERKYSFQSLFMKEDGELDTSQTDKTVSMWYTECGVNSEFVLIPTVRQVYDDLATLVGNGIEGAQRKLGVCFEVQETEKGTRHAVLERVAIISGQGQQKIKQKGLLRLPFWR